MIKYRFFFVAIAALSGLSALAVTPLWLRDVKISPDGSQIAFTYKGDIYKVAAEGGEAQRLTTQPSYESTPVWSPDGKKIAFASDRNGGKDIYLMSADGGSAVRLTSNSASETPESFTPDGKYVVFSASIQDPAKSAMFPTSVMRELYKVPVGGGRPEQVLATPALKISYLPDGKSFVYEDVKGFEDEFRKHHTSSVTRDIWRYDSKTGRHTNLTNRGGEDLNPIVGTDGTTVYFLSERNGGSMNVYSMSAADGSGLKPLTTFKTHPVRFLSQGSNGLMAFTYDGEIYTMKPGAKPAKVKIDVVTDDADETDRLRVGSADESTVSPDGKQLAFTKRGEVFITSTEYPSTKQLTFTPEAESDVAWGKDARELYYTSARDGHYNIYVCKIARDEDPNFSNATVVEETPLFKSDGIDRTYPSISPDGTQMAFIQDRNKLMLMDLKTKKVRQLTDGTTHAHRSKGFKAHWSPDGKWLAISYIQPEHDPYGDIAVIEVATGKLTKVTETGYFDDEPRWVMDGNALLFLSERYGMRNHASWGSEYDVMLTFLNKDSYDRYRLSEEDYALLKEVEKASKKKDKSDDKKDGDKSEKKGKKRDKADKSEGDRSDSDKKDVEIDLTDLADRTVRLTPASADICDAILSKDGSKLYYLAKFENGYDLWEIDLRKKNAKIANKLGGRPMGMEMDSDGNIFLVGSQVKKFEPKSSKVSSVGINTTMLLDLEKEREFMLKYVYNEEKERFFRKDMNGADWDKLYPAYRKFLPHINNNYDFADLLSELLGELNVSHTGGRYYSPSADQPTASLGLLYDMTYQGPGLKVDEVVAKGPFDKATSKMRAGSVITAINGISLTKDADPLAMLNDMANKKTLVAFTTADGAKEEEVVLPISAGAMNDLLYRRWVRQRQDDVERLSGGRLGYVHIKSMDDASFREIYADLLGKYVNKEAIVIDTRWNGGGRLHEDIEVLFSGKPYLTQEIHGQTTSVMPSRRWTKPSIMIIGEANYSNAHGTPWVYSHLGLGKLVGMPVPGTMSSVNWVRLQDPSLVFGIPVTGFRTAEGNYLENTQLEPDVKVSNDPAVIVTGVDQQLKAAVDEMLRQLDKK
ncbi:MAG: S41 family peptidase [Bacteroides sp.]|nr:S41 family peptidase [Bacteroides sp.]MCM1414114.1 S41 family peptidase [Bacteroides sp.]MCM1472378.1 S41 family peptidase [Bacteroides sp.]